MGKFRYLLGANILSSLIKQPSGTLAARIAAMNPEDFCNSIIVAYELRYDL